MLVKRSPAICEKAEWQHGKSQPLHHHWAVILAISKQFAYYIFMKQTTQCPLDSTDRSWSQQQNNGDFLTTGYMADVRATMQKHFC
eukprot:12720831-Ditylum_brightwellii.AAC.1